MTIQKKITIIFLSFLSFLSFNFAHSNDDVYNESESYFYAGQKLGWARYSNNCDDKVNCKIDTFGYSVFSGFQFNRWYALEASISSYGSPDYKINSDFIESNTSIWGGEILSKFRVLDITSHLHAYAKLGLGYQYLNQPSSYTNKSHYFGLLGAAGLEYDITDQWSLRAEVQHIDFKEKEDNFNQGKDVTFSSIGLSYKFGQSRTKTVFQEVEKIVEKTEIQQVNYELVSESFYSNFANDSYELISANDIDKLIPEIKKSQGMITIIGHTDSIGRPLYNYQLSYKRAQSVADYLIKNGIKSDQVFVIGMGEDKPIADNLSYEGRAKNRRVEVIFNRLLKHNNNIETY